MKRIKSARVPREVESGQEGDNALKSAYTRRMGRSTCRSTVLRGARWTLALAGLTLALACVPARAASPYGLLDHFDVCDPSLGDGYHDYVSINSIAVDPGGNIYVAGRDGIIRVLSSGGVLLATLTSGPHGPWEEPVVANGSAGVVYIGDSSDPAQLAKYTLSGASLRLAHTYVTDQGGYATTIGLRRIVGIAATQNRGLFILDDTQGIVNLKEDDGSFISLTLPGGHGRLVGITAIPNAIVTAATSDEAKPDWTAYYTGQPLHYVGEVNVSEFVVGVGDGYDGSVWALTSANPGDPGTHGLEHNKVGTLLGTVPVPGGLDAIDTSSDGSIWVARSDGILHIGQGGAVIPPDQYGHAPCGGPQISDSLPRQSIRASHRLEVLARCGEACSLIAGATLTVQGSRTTYHLTAPPARYSAAGTFDLRLGLPRAAYNALVTALNHHRRGTVLLNMGAIDAGDVRTYFQQRIIIT